MLVSLTEAEQRAEPLMGDLADLAGLEVLEEVFTYQEPKTRARRLLVWLIHEKILSPLDGEAKPLRLWTRDDARGAFRLYIPRPGKYRVDHWGYNEYPDDQVFFNAQALDFLLDFLGSKPGLFLDWQLAYAWAGSPIPSGREWGIRQRDPSSFPPQDQQRLAWIRQFNPGRLSESISPSATASNHAPLFVDGWIGNFNLYSLITFEDLIAGDHHGRSIPGTQALVSPTFAIRPSFPPQLVIFRPGLTAHRLIVWLFGWGRGRLFNQMAPGKI